MSQQKRVWIAALVVFAILLVIVLKTNKPQPSVEEETARATQIAKAPSDIQETTKGTAESRQAAQEQPGTPSAQVTPAPASSEPTSAERPPAESVARSDKPAEQSAPKSQPRAVGTPATEKPEPSTKLDLARPETVKEEAPAEESKSTRLPRLVEIGAEKCIPCRMMQPILAELRKEYAGKLQVDFVDVWKHPEQADKYGIQTIPTQVIYDSSGKEFFRHIGFFAKEQIVAKLAELGVE